MQERFLDWAFARKNAIKRVELRKGKGTKYLRIPTIRFGIEMGQLRSQCAGKGLASKPGNHRQFGGCSFVCWGAGSLRRRRDRFGGGLRNTRRSAANIRLSVTGPG